MSSSVIPKTFGVVDQVIFVASIAIGGIVGIYFGYFAPKDSHQEADYLFGGRRMKTIPIALSLSASFISGITIVGLPAEAYLYGMQWAYATLFHFLATILYNTQFLPVFHCRQGLSLNEYFEKRFDKRLRLLVSVLFFFSSVQFLPVMMYVPSLAYEQITGHDKYMVTIVVCIVCIFYTSIGGLKAVVWTDAIQLVSMLACVFLIFILGIYNIGPSAYWERNVATARLEPPYIDFDPTVRQTIFSVMSGGLLQMGKIGYLSQGQIQRHQSLPTVDQAKKAAWIMMVVHNTIQLLCFAIGLLVFAYYFKCDPITLQIVSAKDQILPLYIMQTMSHYQGINGIFLSGAFSASLSSVSTILNTLSGVFVEDWIRGHTKWNPSEREATWIMRIFVVVVGIASVGFVFIVAKLGTLLQVITSVDAMFSGALLTIFFTALFLPRVSSLGALIGATAAVAVIGPIVVGTQYSISQGLLHFPSKPLSTEGCTEMFNVTSDYVKNVSLSGKTAIPYGPTRGNVWYPVRISHHYFLPLSLACGLIAAVLTTVFFSKTDLRKLDRSLVAPVSTRWLPKSTEQLLRRKIQVVTNSEETQHMLPIELKRLGGHQ